MARCDRTTHGGQCKRDARYAIAVVDLRPRHVKLGEPEDWFTGARRLCEQCSGELFEVSARTLGATRGTALIAEPLIQGDRRQKPKMPPSSRLVALPDAQRRALEERLRGDV